MNTIYTTLNAVMYSGAIAMYKKADPYVMGLHSFLWGLMYTL